MKRPLLLRLLPERLRLAAWARLYRGAHVRRPALYDGAGLQYAPGVTMELLPGDVISDSIAYTGLYEPQLTRRVVELAQQGGLFVEVGTNMGYFALLWAAARPDNRCVAVEASPRNVELLQRNIRRNGFEARIKVVPFAAGRERGRLSFDVSVEHQTGWGGFAGTEPIHAIEVDVVRIDETVDADEKIALLKVDVEGAEAWVLMGCEKLLRSRAVGEIWYEENKPRSRALNIPDGAPQEFLRSVGYVPTPHGDPAGDNVEWSAIPSAIAPNEA